MVHFIRTFSYFAPDICICNGQLFFSLFCLAFRRVLIFPKGNNVDHLSMYLDVADSSSLPYGWSRYSQFSLGVINHIHNKYSVRKGTSISCNVLLLCCSFFILTGWGLFYDLGYNFGAFIFFICILCHFIFSRI